MIDPIYMNVVITFMAALFLGETLSQMLIIERTDTCKRARSPHNLENPF